MNTTHTKHNSAIHDEAMDDLIDQYMMFYTGNNPLDYETTMELKLMVTSLARLAMKIGYEVAEDDL